MGSVNELLGPKQALDSNTRMEYSTHLVKLNTAGFRSYGPIYEINLAY